VVSLGLGLSLFVRPGLRIIASQAYYPAAKLVPLIVAAFVFQAWGSVVQFGVDAAERTQYTTLVAWISTALVMCLYAVLIPPFGAYGAATATLVSFVARTAMLAYWSNKVWPLKYDWSRQLRLLAVGVALVGLDWLIPINGFVPETLIAALLCVVYAIYVWKVELPDDERDAIRKRGARLVSFAKRRMIPA
jgi:O-antigen/teichoic acid export membrane protein